MSAIRGLHHVSFTVRDIERSVAFYRRLGFELERTAVAEEAAYVGGRLDMAFLTAAGVRLELLAYAAGGDREPCREGDLGDSHIALQVDDIDALYRRLSAEGVEFLSTPLRNEDAGARWVFLLDPDGLRVELVELDGRP